MLILYWGCFFVSSSVGPWSCGSQDDDLLDTFFEIVDQSEDPQLVSQINSCSLSMPASQPTSITYLFQVIAFQTQTTELHRQWLFQSAG